MSRGETMLERARAVVGDKPDLPPMVNEQKEGLTVVKESCRKGSLEFVFWCFESDTASRASPIGFGAGVSSVSRLSVTASRLGVISAGFLREYSKLTYVRRATLKRPSEAGSLTSNINGRVGHPGR